MKNRFWLAVCTYVKRTDESLTLLLLKLEEMTMNTLVSSSPRFKRLNALIAVPLFMTGATGVIIGGSIWGLLGVAFVLGSVWWITHTMQSAQLSREIERSYQPEQELFAAAATECVRHSGRKHVSAPLRKLESVSG